MAGVAPLMVTIPDTNMTLSISIKIRDMAFFRLELVKQNPQNANIVGFAQFGACHAALC